MNRSNQPTAPEILAEIEVLAANLFAPSQIAVVIDNPDLVELLEDTTSAEYRAYQRGKLKTKLELHKSVLQLAKQGSGPAQTMALGMLRDQVAAGG